MAKKTVEEQPFDFASEYRKMKKEGVEQILPYTGRRVRLRSVDAPTLLKEGQIPNILTPMIVKMVYQDINDNELRQYTEKNTGDAAHALAMLESLDFVAKHAITDGTKVEDLTISEKRYIFRLVMGAAELLITFRYDEDANVEDVPDGEDLRQTA